MSAVGLQTKIVQQFCLLNGEQKHDLILQLLQNVEVGRLRTSGGRGRITTAACARIDCGATG